MSSQMHNTHHHTSTTNHTTTAPLAGAAREVCSTQNAPITKEHTITHRHEEITPVVDREIDQTQVQQIIQPIADVREEHQHHYGTNAGISREHVNDVSVEDARRYQANRNLHVGSNTRETVAHDTTVNAPVIREKVNQHLVEEVQPVIERTIDQHHVHHTAQPIYEHVTAAPKVAEVRTAAPISLAEFEKRGGAMSGTGLACERQT